ncbi:hypothetical protein JXA84_06635 [candidate division WOR-3 bacterium]|nr:hypothetical protein [candidate division WOR-3 bacterium]
MRKIHLFIILTVLIFSSCSQNPGSQTDSTVALNGDSVGVVVTDTAEIVFQPPEDGIITEEMSDRYISCAKEINALIQQRAETGKNYLDSLGVTYEQLSDSAFKSKNPEIVETYNQITVGGDFSEIEKSIYQRYSMTEDEFIWIASHLSNPENSEIQEKVTEALMDIIAP